MTRGPITKIKILYVTNSEIGKVFLEFLFGKKSQQHFLLGLKTEGNIKKEAIKQA